MKNSTLEKWFLNAFDYIPCSDWIISTTGSNPISEDDFDDYLRINNIKPYPIHDETEVLITGQNNWKEEDIANLLDLREGKSLRIYSQEMYLAHWTTGQDPFDNKAVADAFAESHNALQFVKDCWVDWISTNVNVKNQNGKFSTDSPGTGVLKHLDYTVGRTRGLDSYNRQKILTKVFNFELDKILSKEYIIYCNKNFPLYLDEWGEPKSEKRLRKIRDFLASNCKKHKRRKNFEAAENYEEDLDWLKNTYRTGRFKYVWLESYVK